MTIVLVGMLVPTVASTADTPTPVELIVFHRIGCSFCEAELAFLEGLQERVPSLEVRTYEISTSQENVDRLIATATDLGFEPTGVPVTILGERVWIGFTEQTGREIEAAVAAAGDGEPAPTKTPALLVDVPLLGEVDLGDRSLVLSTLTIGFVDGVNPCSLWVLMMLLALVLRSGSRSRVALVGGVFLTVTALLYGLYMVGFYHAISWMGATSWIRVVVALVVVTLGALQLLDAVRPGLAPSLSIDPDRRPGLFRRMRSLASGDAALPGVVGGTAALAVGVSLLETPCTAGLPVLWTDLVADRGVAGLGFVLLLAVYLLVFLIDELLVFGAAVLTMRAAKLQERHGRSLKLVSGVAMVTLALAMLLRPSLLESMGGALLLVAAVVVIATLVAVLVPTPQPAGRSTDGGTRGSAHRSTSRVGWRRAHHA